MSHALRQFLMFQSPRLSSHTMAPFPSPPPPIFVVQRDTDALPDVELAVPRLQQQRVLEVLLDHVHLALLVYEVQELSGLGGNEDAFTCGNQNGS